MMMRKFMTIVLCVLLTTQCVRAIYEDQAGEFDWSVENLGRVTAVAYGGGDKRSGHGNALVRGTSRAMYVATDADSRTLSRMDSKTGEIKWRRMFEPSDHVEAIQLTNYGLLAVSTGGQMVRMWDIADGTLVWDNKITASIQSTETKSIFAIGDDRVLIVTSSTAFVMTLKDGRLVWKTALESSNVESAQLSDDGQSLFVLGSNALTTIRVQNGDMTTQNDLKNMKMLVKNHDGRVVAVGLPTSTSVSVYDVQSQETKVTPITSMQLPTGKRTQEFTQWEARVKNVPVLQLNCGKRVAVSISSALDAVVSAVIGSDGVITESQSDEATLFHIIPSGNDVKIASYGADQQALQWKAEFSTALYGGDVMNAFVGCSMRKKDSQTPRCRALLVMVDDGLVMTTNDETTTDEGDKKNVLWIREESLAYVQQVEWITPAETEIEKQPLKKIPSFTEELALEVQRLRHFVDNILSFSSALLNGGEDQRVRGAHELQRRKEPVNAHFFGFSKYIVLLTQSGRLFAIRAETNQVAWTSFVGRNQRLFVMRDHPAFGTGAELLLVSTTQLVWLDGDDGHEIERAAVTDFSSKLWTVLLPKRKHHTIDEDATGARRSIALIAPDSMKVKIFPSNAVATDVLDQFYFYRYDDAKKAFGGYVIVQDKDGYRAEQVWSIVLPENQVLAATSHQSECVVVDSAVTVTGDDSLLLKYLNPHLFGVASIANEPVEGDMASVLYVQLIDSVSGRLVHRVRHVHGSGPVQMVQSENWAVYSFWNAKEKRTELVSLSLFDGAVGSHSLNPWKRPSWTDVRSSYDPKAPFVLQKSFIYPTRIRSLGVTITSRGITPQFVLVGMENGQVFKLARPFIDPRQPEKAPTPEEQSEGLMQYSPLIPVYNNPIAMVSYNKSIANLQSIATTPVELESTTLVFAYGLDLFYSRLAPAKSFDLLPSDFNYELLVLLCIGFLVATVVSRNLARRKALHQAWK